MNERLQAEQIAKRIAEKGGRAYYVGGCVRDGLLGRPCKDLDIEVYGLSPDDLEAVLSQFGNVLTVGKSFGIFKLEHSGLDIALPRTEEKTGEGHRAFLTSADPHLDPRTAASRRDFTVNALLKDVLSGELFDFFRGLEDLSARILRHVSGRSFPEDPLRVLRAARFAAQLGFTVAAETAELCGTIDLFSLSRERVEGETEKALLSGQPSRYFAELKRMGQLDVFYSGLKGDPEILDTAAALRKEAGEPVLYMLGVLLSLVGEEDRESFLNRFMTKKYELKELRKWDLSGSTEKTEIFSRLDALEYPGEYILCLRALYPQSADALKELYEEYLRFLQKEHITGEELIALGHAPGRELGELLKKVRREEYTRNRDEILEELKK